MAVITKSGKPRSTTPASIGDIYINSDTGEKYRCTFSYKDNYGVSTYTWKEIEPSKVVENEKPEEPSEVKESEKPDDKVEEPAENEKSDDAVKEPAKPQQPQRFNYNQQYNKHKR